MEGNVENTENKNQEQKNNSHDIFKNKIKISLVGAFCGMALGALCAKKNDSRILASLTLALVGYELGNIVADGYQLRKMSN